MKGIFNRPAGICFSYHPEPSILIADKDNHRIQVSPGPSRDPVPYGTVRDVYGEYFGHIEPYLHSARLQVILNQLFKMSNHANWLIGVKTLATISKFT